MEPTRRRGFFVSLPFAGLVCQLCFLVLLTIFVFVSGCDINSMVITLCSFVSLHHVLFSLSVIVFLFGHLFVVCVSLACPVLL